MVLVAASMEWVSFHGSHCLDWAENRLVAVEVVQAFRVWALMDINGLLSTRMGLRWVPNPLLHTMKRAKYSCYLEAVIPQRTLTRISPVLGNGTVSRGLSVLQAVHHLGYGIGWFMMLLVE
jgi:hypothetical protein